MERRYLEPTPMLNYDANNIRCLIKERKWDELAPYPCVKEIYDFVQNQIPFGYNRSDLLTAEEVLQDGYGQCNTKATLLMALLRAVSIPCRLHGTQVGKDFQKGITTATIHALAPKTIVHTWVEAFVEEKWITLEGVITDLKYVDAVKRICHDATGPFFRYAIATKDIRTLSVQWDGRDRYVQKEAVVIDYGVFDNPDSFFRRHRQKWNWFIGFCYVNIGRKIMTRNVNRIRNQFDTKC